MTVTDKDRQAALNVYKGFLAGIRGEDDAQSLVAAFAAHRLATIEQCAETAFERLNPSADMSDDELTEYGKNRRIAAIQACEAIRALTEGGEDE